MKHFDVPIKKLNLWVSISELFQVIGVKYVGRTVLI